MRMEASECRAASGPEGPTAGPTPRRADEVLSFALPRIGGERGGLFGAQRFGLIPIHSIGRRPASLSVRQAQDPEPVEGRGPWKPDEF